ncbi:MAG: vWA domain-containing protein [Pirellulales bacterium]
MNFCLRTKIVALLLVSVFSSFGVLEAKDSARNKTAPKVPQVEVCFVLDTTGSMASLIQGAKDKIWSIANELASAKPTPNIKFGLVAYRDRKDDFVTKSFNLTDDIDTLYEHLMSFQAKGGGDSPESVNQALHDAVTEMSWSENKRVLKLVFLVGDAPPHMDYPNDILYPEVCKLALEKRLIINTIQCGTMAETTRVWRDIADKSEGQFAAILQSGGTIAIATPYDKKIAEINLQLNLTIVGYGDIRVQNSVKSKVANNAEAKPEAVADRADYYRNLRGSSVGGGGFGGKVLGGEEDLVEQVIQNKIKLEEIDREKLPDDLKKLTPEKQIIEIQARVESRKKLQTQINELLKNRNAYMIEEKKKQAKEGNEDGFDLKVKEMIRKQAADKGIVIEAADE